MNSACEPSDIVVLCAESRVSADGRQSHHSQTLLQDHHKTAPTETDLGLDNVARSVKHNKRKYGNYFQNCQTTAAQFLSCDAYHVLKSIQLHVWKEQHDTNNVTDKTLQCNYAINT